jgi:aspartyl-tRNA(Asn)/glutamyl-tRNA(Gln) amidotransferase subunit B
VTDSKLIEATDELETVIGLECHVELATATKMFCPCRNEFGAPPNSNVCPVCLGHPGTLPVPNEKAIEFTIKIGLALDCQIAPYSLFHRKNYFYPDMPKNYQISQYDLPLCVDGHLDIEVDGASRRIGITRVHLEEDTGKTFHAGATGRIAEADYALEDYNRAGVPLVEVVSEPDMRTAEEARAYLTELRGTLEALGVSDVRMEEGSLRCDANISIRRQGEGFGTKVEIKNLNSIRSLHRALRYEEERQRTATLDGTRLIQETRHWDEDRGVTSSLRSKEYAFDYRYFPEPDLAPIEPDPERIEKLRAQLPELPSARRRRFEEEYGLEPRAVAAVASDTGWAPFFEETVSLGADPRAVANWMTGDLAGLLNEARVELGATRITPRHIAQLVKLVDEKVLSSAGAKAALLEAFETGGSIQDIVEVKGLRQVSDRASLESVVEQVLAENPGPADQFRKGKEGALNALVGKVMQKTRGSANPSLAGELLREHLTG